MSFSILCAAALVAAPMDIPAADFALEPRPGDLVVLPFGEGMAYPVETDIPMQAPHLRFSNGMSLSMGFFGRFREGEWTMFGVADMLDAGLAFSRTNGLLRVAYKGTTNNVLRVFRAKTLGAAAAAYRSWREGRGGVRTLADKARTNPRLRDFPGTADVWLWDDNTQNRLYNWPRKADAPVRDTRRIADEMKALGLDRVLWNSFEGETPEDCAYLKSIGYHVGTYECLRDVFHKGLLDVADPKDFVRAARFLPIADEITRVNADGTLARAWSIPDKAGKMHPMHALCDAMGLEMCRRFIAPEVARIGYDSRLMDVQAGGGPVACWSKTHPCTGREALEALRREHRYMCDDLQQITGVEVGSELLVDAYHYSEGLTSCPHPFRKELCWRYKDRALYGADVPEATKNILHNPRYRIPLWELVYHDCTVSYYYWADSTLMYPELTRTKDLFCALYGLPPIYSMNVSTWNQLKHEVAASYRRATPVARCTMFARMTDFEILTPDRLVQRTRFSNGVCVTANFSSADYRLENGSIVHPQTFVLSSSTCDSFTREVRPFASCKSKERNATQ